MLKVILLVFFAEIFGVAGQVLFKQGTNRLETPAIKQWRSYWAFVRGIFQLPGIWLGLLTMAVSLVIWLAALSRSDLSLVFPVGSIHYVLILIASRIFLKEKIDAMKLSGTFLIIVGIIAIAFS